MREREKEWGSVRRRAGEKAETDSPAIPPAKPDVRAYWSESLSSLARFLGRVVVGSAAAAAAEEEEEEAGGGGGGRGRRVGASVVASSRVTLEVDAVGGLIPSARLSLCLDKVRERK